MDRVSQPNHFERLKVLPMFEPEMGSLRQNYYEFSRNTHPDRFVTSSEMDKASALAEMTQLNEAFRVLSTKALREQYLCEVLFIDKSQLPKPTLPALLAEQWFELQEMMMEGDSKESSLKEAFLQFSKALEAEKSKIQSAKSELQKSWDQKILSAGVETVAQFAEVSDQQNLLKNILILINQEPYLKSIEREFKTRSLVFLGGKSLEEASS